MVIRVAIIEDDSEIRVGIQEFLAAQKDIICDMAKSSVEAFIAEFDPAAAPDIILMDIGLPGMSGIDGMKLIRAKSPDIDFVMFTVYEDSFRVFQTLCAGACGYLLKNSRFEDILRTIKTVYSGGSVMSPGIARKVIEHFRMPKAEKPPSVLSPKEQEVVLGLVDGLSYKMIAGRMSISIETVRSHIKNIYKKLHVHSKAEVIRKSLGGEI